MINYCQALQFIPDWFLTSKMIEKLDSAVFSNDYTAFEDLDTDFVTFFSRDIGFNNITLDNIILMIIILIIVIQKLLIMLKLWLGIINSI